MREKLNNYILIVPFLFIIFFFAICNELNADKETSFIENRNLAQEPDFSIKNIKDFTTSYEKYYSDQFIGREKLLTAYINLQTKLNKSVVQNVYIKNDWLLGKIDVFSKESLDSKIDNILTLNKNIPDKKIHYFSVPHKASALSHLYPKYDTTVKDHLANKDYLISQLNKNGIPAYNMDNIHNSKFTTDELESMYYKTDHHWNAFGAYSVTKEILNILDITIDDSMYNIEETNNKNFLGSYNRKLGSLFSKKETLSYIVPNNTNDFSLYAYKNGALQEVNPKYYLCSQRDLEEVSYGGFYQGDLPYLKIVNENSLTDRKIVIVRDSYQAPTTLLFSSIFREVEIVDDRHISSINKTLEDIIKDSEATDVIFFKYL